MVPVTQLTRPIIGSMSDPAIGITCRAVRARMVVAISEDGKRIGETHHNAWISDAIVDQIRERHEDDGWGYVRLSREFGIALTTVRKICTYERRAQTPARWKTLRGVHG